MSDEINDPEFEAMMARAGFADAFDVDALSVADTGVIGPDMADDHTALHLLEALTQVTKQLDAEGFVARYALAEDVVEVPHMLTVGTGEFLDEIRDYAGPLEFGSPLDIEFMAWVRRAGGVMSLALDQYLKDHDIPRFTSWVWLSGHGFNVFQLAWRDAPPADTSWMDPQPASDEA